MDRFMLADLIQLKGLNRFSGCLSMEYGRHRGLQWRSPRLSGYMTELFQWLDAKKERNFPLPFFCRFGKTGQCLSATAALEGPFILTAAANSIQKTR